jgi:hypothetical protein
MRQLAATVVSSDDRVAPALQSSSFFNLSVTETKLGSSERGAAVSVLLGLTESGMSRKVQVCSSAFRNCVVEAESGDPIHGLRSNDNVAKGCNPGELTTDAG